MKMGGATPRAFLLPLLAKQAPVVFVNLEPLPDQSLLAHPTEAFTISFTHPSSILNVDTMEEAQAQDQENPGLHSTFWNPTANRPFAIYDIEAQVTSTEPTERAEKLQQHCEDRIDIYKQIEKAIADERRSAKQNWYHRLARAYCCGCCYGYSPVWESVKTLGSWSWTTVHEWVWKGVFVNFITPIRVIYTVLQMCFRVAGRGDWAYGM
jgi:hypothetical protein